MAGPPDEWWVDDARGDDRNSGRRRAPLRTLTELYRRLQKKDSAMPPYVQTHDGRVHRGGVYTIVRPTDGASLGRCRVDRFEPDHLQILPGHTDGYAMPDPLRAVVELPMERGKVARLTLPLDWLADEKLPQASLHEEEEGVETVSWKTLMTKVIVRTQAGVGLQVREGAAEGEDHGVVRLVWSTGDQATIVMEDDGEYERGDPTLVLTTISAEALRRRTVIQEELARAAEEKQAQVRRENMARVAAHEERRRAAWPRFELHLRSARGEAHPAAPHPAAVWNVGESRWEVAAPSLDTLIADVLGDVVYAMNVLPRGRGAPPDVLTTIEIQDVALPENGHGDAS